MRNARRNLLAVGTGAATIVLCCFLIGEPSTAPLLYASQQQAYEVLIYDAAARHGLPVGKITNGVVLPNGVAVDAAENLYVANANATVTVYARGKRSPSRTYYRGLQSVNCVAVGADGTLYVCNTPYGSPSGIVVFAPGSRKPSYVLPLRSFTVTSIAVDAAGDVYAAGYSGSASDVVEFSAATRLPKHLGLQLNDPAGLALAPDGSLVASDYAAQYQSGEVKVFPPGATVPSRIFGRTGTPGGIAFDANGDVLFVADGATNVVEGYRYSDGRLVKIFASGMLQPYAVAVSPPAPAAPPFVRPQATERVVFSFGYKNGANPDAGLVFDTVGDLFGSTAEGGANTIGALFELSPGAGGQWTERVLHDFGLGNDGDGTFAPLIFSGGNLYGTTISGHGSSGWGTVFELSPSVGGWTYSTIHRFVGSAGRRPNGLVADRAGNLYGTASEGGAQDAGTAYQLTRDGSGRWNASVLHSFTFNRGDGYSPTATLIIDTAGNLYGTARFGGSTRCSGPSGHGCGTVFEITPSSRQERTLHRFMARDRTDGANPMTPTVFDASGNLYGTTFSGGANGVGSLFEVMPAGGHRGTERVIYSFSNGPDGHFPDAGLVTDNAGNLYGTTVFGGSQTCGFSGTGCGVVYELQRGSNGTWTYAVLYRFAGGSDGEYPHGTLVFDGGGHLYGTTFGGGASGYGTVFEITP